MGGSIWPYLEERADLHTYFSDEYRDVLLEEARKNNVTLLGALERGTARLPELQDFTHKGLGYDINLYMDT